MNNTCKGWDEVCNKARGHERNCAWSKILVKINYQTWDRVRSRLRINVWDQINMRIKDQVYDHITDQLYVPIRDRFWG